MAKNLLGVPNANDFFVNSRFYPKRKTEKSYRLVHRLHLNSQSEFLTLIICFILSYLKMTKQKANPPPSKVKTAKDFLKEYPKPPAEHTYELKIEKRIKRMIKDEEEKKKQ